tara:strand:+ start:1837 stop:2466 length:630 start_codon:yes stop_codon:yes gene_type:complete
LFSSNLNYRIKFFGIYVADCEIDISDTTIYNIEGIKLNYKIRTKPFINNFFNVNNYYTIIIDKNKYNTLLYKKKTVQPKIINYIETEFVNNKIKYNESNIYLNEDDFNIFSILYLIANNEKEIISSIKQIEREGKYYAFSFLNENNSYELILNEINNQDKGLIEHTDIFLWGIFLPNTNNSVIVNDLGYIEKCTFKRGLLTMSAKIDIK